MGEKPKDACPSLNWCNRKFKHKCVHSQGYVLPREQDPVQSYIDDKPCLVKKPILVHWSSTSCLADSRLSF